MVFVEIGDKFINLDRVTTVAFKQVDQKNASVMIYFDTAPGMSNPVKFEGEQGKALLDMIRKNAVKG